MAARSALIQNQDPNFLIEEPSPIKAISVPAGFALFFAALFAVSLYMGHIVGGQTDTGTTMTQLWDALTAISIVYLLFLVGIIIKGDYASGKQAKANCLALRQKVAAGQCCICDPDLSTWEAFVEATWGRGGAEHRQRPPIVGYLIIGLLIGVIAFLFVKVKSLIGPNAHEMPWGTCAVIGFPVGIFLALTYLAIDVIRRQRRYSKLRSRAFPLVLAPTAVYFAGQCVAKDVTSTKFIRSRLGNPNVLLVEVSYTNDRSTMNKHCKLIAPISAAHEKQAKVYVAKHNGFYKGNVVKPTSQQQQQQSRQSQSIEVDAASANV